MTVYHAFFDESGKKRDHHVVTFAGVFASQESLDSFNQSWNDLLDKCELKSFHMKVLSDLNREPSAKIPETHSFDVRMEQLKPFADCINTHLEIGLIQAWDVKGFTSIDPKVSSGLGNPDDPYYLAFARMMAEMPDLICKEDQIAIVCDFDEQTAAICNQHYLGIIEADDSIRKAIVSLKFEDDEFNPALQAADMAAYLSRRAAARRFHATSFHFEKLYDYLISGCTGGKMKWKALFMDEAAARALTPP